MGKEGTGVIYLGEKKTKISVWNKKLVCFQHGLNDAICNLTHLGKLRSCWVMLGFLNTQPYAITNSFTSLLFVCFYEVSGLWDSIWCCRLIIIFLIPNNGSDVLIWNGFPGMTDFLFIVKLKPSARMSKCSNTRMCMVYGFFYLFTFFDVLLWTVINRLSIFFSPQSPNIMLQYGRAHVCALLQHHALQSRRPSQPV